LRDQDLNLFTTFEALRFALPDNPMHHVDDDENETEPPDDQWREDEYDPRDIYANDWQDMYMFGTDKKAWRNGRYHVHLVHTGNRFVVVDDDSDDDHDPQYHWEPGMAWGDQVSEYGDDYYDDDEFKDVSPPADPPQHFRRLESRKPSSPDKSSEASAGSRPKSSTLSKAAALSPSLATPPAHSQAAPRRRRSRRRGKNSGSSKDSTTGTNRTPPSLASAPPLPPKGPGAAKAKSQVRWSEKLSSIDA
jgi:hypothetical protein